MGLFDSLIATILQGIAITTIGLFAYQTGGEYFKNFSSNQFKSKTGAQLTIVGFLFFTGVVSDPLFQILKSLTVDWRIHKEIGIVLITSRALVNGMVSKWNLFDEGSVAIYAIGSSLTLYSEGFI